MAGLATVLASIASALSNLPVLYRVTKNAHMARRLAIKTGIVALVGAAVLAAQYWLNLGR
jgi:hypothetical protein